jgi:hypothetical protein
MDNTEQRELTYGEKALGLTFNPSNDETVDKVKRLYAEIIDTCNNLRTEAGPGEKGRLLSVAITEAQTAQMWAIKGVTYKF